jgi:nitrogen-specific signal transduction histidine kinase/CheY-like chemotaxis protein
MIINTLSKQKPINPWHFVWLSVVFSELFTAFMNTVQSFIWYGKFSSDLLMIGAIDGLFVPLIVAPIVFYFTKHAAELKKMNAQLQHEIAERSQAEEALARSEARYRAMVNAFDGFLYICSPDYRIEFMNDRMKKRVGYDATGEFCYKVLNERESICPWCVHDKVAKGETVRWEMQSPKDNRWYYVTNTPIYNTNGTVSKQAMFIDITDRKAREEELLYGRKLESIGILAGGIAHDFNNLLAGILGNIELAKMLTVREGNVYERLEEAGQATLRAKDLTMQLLTFSKGGEPVKSIIAIGELIKESVRFALRGSNVKCEFSIPDNLWPVDVDEGQMNQVVNNVIINADQAMPEGGTITVACENVTLGASEVPPLKEGKYIRISVEDRGIGISKEHLSRIFDPYFTTKQRGSGLGLATSYSIIKKHHGQITVESARGVGTVIRIYLPASEGTVVKKDVKKEELLKGAGRILVMDDDEILRGASKSMLKVLGYEVALAQEGAEAIAAYQQAKEAGRPFDAVIMDLTIPGGMGGKETIKKLLEIDPAAKAIVSSGYSNDPVMAEYAKYGFRGAMIKPYRIKDLGAVISRVITMSS